MEGLKERVEGGKDILWIEDGGRNIMLKEEYTERGMEGGRIWTEGRGVER